MSSTLRIAAVMAGASALCLAAMAAVAQPKVEEIVVHPASGPLAVTQHKTVSYRDLDLNSPDGQKTMYRRLKAASQQVCSPQPDMKTKSDYPQCYDGAMSGALADLGNSGVSALYKK